MSDLKRAKKVAFAELKAYEGELAEALGLERYSYAFSKAREQDSRWRELRDAFEAARNAEAVGRS